MPVGSEIKQIAAHDMGREVRERVKGLSRVNCEVKNVEGSQATLWYVTRPSQRLRYWHPAPGTQSATCRINGTDKPTVMAMEWEEYHYMLEQQQDWVKWIERERKDRSKRETFMSCDAGSSDSNTTMFLSTCPAQHLSPQREEVPCVKSSGEKRSRRWCPASQRAGGHWCGKYLQRDSLAVAQ